MQQSPDGRKHKWAHFKTLKELSWRRNERQDVESHRPALMQTIRNLERRKKIRSGKVASILMVDANFQILFREYDL